MAPDPLHAVRPVLADQSEVIARVQLGKAGVTPARIDTMLRRGDLVKLHPGVYVAHTGTPTWTQRAWAAVLYASSSALAPDAALHLDSALQEGDRSTGRTIVVAIDWKRRVASRTGVRIIRVRNLADQVKWNLSPPRATVEHAALERAHRAVDDLAAISALATVVGARRTVVARVRPVLAARSRMRRRALLGSVLVDLDNGTHSVLEHGYLDRVLRPHGLPEPSQRQEARESEKGRQYRDVVHEPFVAGGPELVVELDGSQHDLSDQRDDDADRDLDDHADGRISRRLRYRQVFGTPCRTAARLAAILHGLGWEGSAHPCSSPGCDVA